MKKSDFVDVARHQHALLHGPSTLHDRKMFMLIILFGITAVCSVLQWIIVPKSIIGGSTLGVLFVGMLVINLIVILLEYVKPGKVSAATVIVIVVVGAILFIVGGLKIIDPLTMLLPELVLAIYLAWWSNDLTSHEKREKEQQRKGQSMHETCIEEIKTYSVGDDDPSKLTKHFAGFHDPNQLRNDVHHLDGFLPDHLG